VRALFSWIPSAAQLPRFSLCKVPPCGFCGKTWEVLSTSVVMPDLRAEAAKPWTVADFLRAHGFDRAVRLFPCGLPTKVDLHVRGVTPTKKRGLEDAEQGRVIAIFPRNFVEPRRSAFSLGSDFPQGDPLVSRFENLARIM